MAPNYNQKLLACCKFLRDLPNG